MKEGRRVKTEAEKGSVDDWLKICRTLRGVDGWRRVVRPRGNRRRNCWKDGAGEEGSGVPSSIRQECGPRWPLRHRLPNLQPLNQEGEQRYACY